VLVYAVPVVYTTFHYDMTQVPLREAQDCLEDLLARVEEGETILITRSGRPPVRLGPVQKDEDALPSLQQWREALQVRGEPLSETVQRQRHEDRY
jgi:prevent-host-death family protein